MVPKAIRRRDGGLAFDWDGAGHAAFFAGRALRLACPCAACVDEMTGRPLLDPAAVAADVRAETVELVGAYGIRVRFSDGHGTGIYTFEALAARCPCDACEGRRRG